MSFNERETHTHPSYGMVYIGRVSSSGKRKFFGSELEVDHFITLEIKPGEMQRELSNDWFFAGHNLPYIEVNMTPLQFTELITNINVGDGVPCTISHYNGKNVEPDEIPETKKDATHRQFKERMKEFASTMVAKRNKAKDIVKKKILSKDDQHELLHHLDWLTQELTENIPFFMECFQETADRVVAEAKAEVEAAILHKVTTLGIERLHEQNKLLGQ